MTYGSLPWQRRIRWLGERQFFPVTEQNRSTAINLSGRNQLIPQYIHDALYRTKLLSLVNSPDSNAIHPRQSNPSLHKIVMISNTVKAMKFIHKRLLFVDDEPAIRKTVPLILRRYGYSVAVAGTVHEALELIQSQTFNLLLCDLNIEREG